MKRKTQILAAAVETLEIRRLFATLVVNGSNGDDDCTFEVDANFIYANMNGLLIPQPVGSWDDVQINLQGGDDQLIIINTGSEPVNVDLGSGQDLVQIANTTKDLDSISARVFVAAGSDGFTDQIEIHDDDDTGSDEYEIFEPASSPMRLRKLSSGTPGPEKVLWGEADIHAELYLNDFDNDVFIDSTVAMLGTDERLSVTGGNIASGDVGGSGGNDTVNFNGTINGTNSFFFHGGPGTDVLNMNTNSITSGVPLFEMRPGSGTGDTLNITDPAPTTRYSFVGGNFVKFYEGATQTAEFLAAVDVINITSTHATQGAEFEMLAIHDDTDVVIAAGAGDDSLTMGDNFITTDFGPSVDIDFTGGSGADSVEILDGSYNAQRNHTFAGTTYDSDFLGVLSMSSVSSFVLFAGDGGNNIDVGSLVLQTLELNGGNGNDVFTILPNVVTNIEANGSSPVVAPGDVLLIDVGSATDGVFTANGASGGTYDYDARSPIVFTSMEQFPTPTTSTPLLPNLNTTHDTGSSSTDNITNLTSLTFTGGAAPSGNTVKLYRNGVEVATAVPVSGNYTFSNVAFPTGDATFQMTTRYINNATQLLSPVSAALSVRVDTIAPTNPTAAPDLAAGSDSGLSSTDNITNDVTPTFTGTSPADAIVNLFDGATEIASETDLVANYSITAPSMSEGSRNMTVRFEDVAGNLSSVASAALVMTIDTIAPATPVATDLDVASDTGFSSTDNITFDKTPTFNGTSPVNQVVRVFNGTTLIGSETDLVAGYSITASGGVNDGSHQITVRMEDIAGNQSSDSPVLGLVIDTAAPAAPSAPDLDGSSDTGVSSTDNITRDNTPSFTGFASPDTTVRIFSSTNEVGSQHLGSGQTFYNVTTSALTDGNRAMTMRFEDLAGNTSAASPVTTVTVDTVGPTVSNPVFNFQTGSQNIKFTYSENVSATLAVSDLTLSNGTTIPSASIALSYVPNVATFTFPGFAQGILPNGDYTASIPGANVSDVAGNPAASALLNFFFIQGDANHDHQINFDDYSVIDFGFNNGLNGFANGDFNYDGQINFDDYAIIDLAFNTQGRPSSGPQWLRPPGNSPTVR